LSLKEIELAASTTVSEAIDEYELLLRKNEHKTRQETVRRLRLFFVDLDRPVSCLTRTGCEALYKVLTERISDHTGKPFAVASHQGILVDAKTFGRWCVEKRWLGSNPLDGIKPIGRRKRGKPQLHVDEARAWLAKAVEFAEAGEAGAVAAMTSLLMGMRCSEIVTRQVRDLDDGGKLLWITKSKTDAGLRNLEVPEVLRPYLLRLARDKKPIDRLFGSRWRDWPRKWVERICQAAGVMKVSAHGMRGLHSTLAIRAGSTAHVVAASLGHESFATTLHSYADPAALPAARQRAVLSVLEGGK
jgi:integrase